MKMINRFKLLTLISAVILQGFLLSCADDNENATSGEVVLLSFGPSGVKHGDKISFIGNNLDKVTSIELTGATISSANFLSASSELIELVVPVEAAEGLITLKTEDAAIVSKTKLSFEVDVTLEPVTQNIRPGSDVTLKGNFLNWVKSVSFGKDLVVTEFVSQSLNELVVKVPLEAKTAPLFLTTGGTKPLVIESEDDVIVTLPSASSLSPNPIEREGNLTITGVDLDLVNGVLFKGITVPVTQFISKTPTQIVLKVPAGANKGKITIVSYSGVQIESTESLLFVGDLPDLAPLAYAFYVDALQNGWQNWGWGSTVDFSSTDNVRDGASSIKLNYTGSWGALKFANGSVSTANYSEITFSVFGTPGTEGKKINITPSGGSTYELTIEEGKWVEYKLTKASFGNPATITDFTFQNQDWSGIVFVDQVGLR